VNLRILLSFLPVAVFFGLTRIAPAWVAVGGGFAASGAVFYTNRRHRLIGMLTAFGFSVVALSALVGIVSNSEKAYLASGPLSDFLFVPVYLGSIYVGKPLVGGIARELMPGVAGRVAPNAALFGWLSLAWAAYDLFHGAIRVVLLSNLSVGEYLVWSRLVGWPMSGALLALTGWLIYRAAMAREPALVADAAPS
jgi:intracellular septation protein A